MLEAKLKKLFGYGFNFLFSFFGSSFFSRFGFNIINSFFDFNALSCNFSLHTVQNGGRYQLAVELNDDEARTLAGAMTRRDLGHGEVLVAEGSADDHLYVVVSGVLGVVKAAGTDAEVTLNAIRPGDVVGELSFLDGSTRYASLVALSDTRVLGLSRDALEGLLDTKPKVVYHVMRAIVRVVHEIQRRLSMQTAELTNYLYKTHGRY